MDATHPLLSKSISYVRQATDYYSIETLEEAVKLAEENGKKTLARVLKTKLDARIARERGKGVTTIVKSLVMGGADKVKIEAQSATLADLEAALEFANKLPLAQASKSLRKQLETEIRRKQKEQ